MICIYKLGTYIPKYLPQNWDQEHEKVRKLKKNLVKIISKQNDLF